MRAPTRALPARTLLARALLTRALLAGAFVATVALAASAPARPGTAPVRADDGARIVAERRVGPRTLDLTIDSPALGRTAPVRLLLPPGFAARKRSWPVLYLLHGANDGYLSWTRETDVEALTAELDVLVVMPSAGADGCYCDPEPVGRWVLPRWETFHLDEVRQLLERGYRAGPRRAVAGLSMGGLGAMSYAARRPGMFAAAASYSGVLDLPGALHNPVELVDRMRGVALYVSSGDGTPGPFDRPTLPDAAYSLERWLYPQSVAFAARAAQLGVPATVDLYGGGTHTWPYWQRALRRSLPTLLSPLGVRA